MMAPAKVVVYFLVGLALGAFFVTVADRVYEGGWRGGPDNRGSFSTCHYRLFRRALGGRGLALLAAQRGEG